MAKALRCKRCGSYEHLTEAQKERLLLAAEVLPDHALVAMVEGIVCQAMTLAARKTLTRVIKQLRVLKRKADEIGHDESV